MVNTPFQAKLLKLLLVLIASSWLASCATMKDGIGDIRASLGDLVKREPKAKQEEAEDAGLEETAAAEGTDPNAAEPAPVDRTRIELTALSEAHAAEAAEAKREYERAIESMKTGHNQEAMVLFQSIAARFPLLAGPWINQALIHLRLTEYGPAATKLHKAISLYPDHPLAHNLLGIAQRELGQFNAAKESYQKALEVDKNYAKAHYNLAVLADLYLRDYTLALDHFKTYQTLLDEPDKKVKGWIKDLTRRAKAQASAAQTNQLAQEATNQGAE